MDDVSLYLFGLEWVTHSELLFNVLLICEAKTVLETIFQVYLRMLCISSVVIRLMIMSSLKFSEKKCRKWYVQVEVYLLYHQEIEEFFCKAHFSLPQMELNTRNMKCFRMQHSDKYECLRFLYFPSCAYQKLFYGVDFIERCWFFSSICFRNWYAYTE